MQKFGLFLTGLALSASASYGQLANDAATVTNTLDGIADNAISLFDKVAPVVVAVVALGILIAFVKMIKKR
jgi:hypothetical protein